MPLFRKVQNFEEEGGPKFEGDFVAESSRFEAPVIIVSYNIDKGKKVREAIEDLTQIEALKNSDILLLQEMDEKGVEEIALNCGYRYVYYPASVMNGRNFGNAILTKWILTQPKKIILPRKSRYNGQIRIAVRAKVVIDGRPILVYCAHTEIYTASIQHRRLQAAAIVADIPHQETHVLAGGDFNTVSKRSIRRLTSKFAEAGMERASRGSGATVRKYATDPSAADHIFTWGFEVQDRGRVKEAKASDHYPIWAALNFPD